MKVFLNFSHFLAPTENPCTAYGPQYFPLPGYPHCYIQCAFERLFVKPCPANLVWNSRINVCDWPTVATNNNNYGSSSYGNSGSSYGSSSSYGGSSASSYGASPSSYGGSSASSYGASPSPSYVASPSPSYGRKKRLTTERKKRGYGGGGGGKYGNDYGGGSKYGNDYGHKRGGYGRKHFGGGGFPFPLPFPPLPLRKQLLNNYRCNIFELFYVFL